MDFGDLNDDAQIKEKITQVYNSVDKIKQILNVAYKSNVQEQLSTMDKVNYDLFLSYTVNTLYWIYLRTKGIDPNKNDIKNELNRVRDYMIKAKQTHDRTTIRSRIDKQASKRFVKHGLGIPREAKEPPNKKIKFK